ncbi:MAG: hypothetical protein K8U57_35795 [Planctomycetes bacterium]|nr:hypothetical protein [Planctomycetota bacterium]
MTNENLAGIIALIVALLVGGLQFVALIVSIFNSQKAVEDIEKRRLIMLQRQQHAAAFEATSGVILDLELANTPNAFGRIYQAVKLAIESYEAKRAT